MDTLGSTFFIAIFQKSKNYLLPVVEQELPRVNRCYSFKSSRCFASCLAVPSELDDGSMMSPSSLKIMCHYGVIAIAIGLCCFKDHAVVRAYSSEQQPSLQRQKISSSAPSATTASNKSKNEMLKRRIFLAKTISTVIMSSAASLFLTKPNRAHGVEPTSSSKNYYCAYGEGEGCEDLAEGNPLILELQRKSSANKETNQKEARNAFYMKNYPDWFATVGKTMVKKPDGTFVVLSDEELADLKAQNKIGLEYAKTMGGKIADVTQKPIMVLKE
jgi:hypothetical protein